MALASLLRFVLPDFRGLPQPFWVLFVGTLVNRTGGFVLVFLAIYLTETRGLTAAQAGAVMTAYGVGAICGGPTGGALSDRAGRRPTLVMSLIGGGLAMLVLGFVTTVPSIVAAALATGLLYEMYRPVVSATIADVVPSADRPRAYGLIYWAVNIGASIAPLLGGVIAARSYRALFAADAATTALYGVILWAALPETRPAAAPPSSTSEQDQPGHGALRTILADRIFVTFCVLTFVASIVFFQSFVGLPIDLRARGVPSTTFGALIALNGVMIVLLQPLATDRLRHLSPTRVLAVAAFLIGGGFGMTAWVGSAAGFALTVAIWTIGEILLAPSSQSFAADLAPPHMRGAYQGAFALAFTAAFAAAPAIGGAIIARAGAPWLWHGCLVTGAVVAAGFLLLGRRHR